MAPIVLFIYNRPLHTKKTLEALSRNTLAQESDLYIFADGPKINSTLEHLEKIRETREIAHSEKWCRSVTIYESEENRGLAESIVSGVTEIVNKYGSVIVLEDDIVTGKHFLEFMNESLEKYQDSKKVWHITGWRDPVHSRHDSSFFYPNMDCWGWATWADRWQNYKKDPVGLKATFTQEMIKKFNMDGSEPGNWWQVENNISGNGNTWAIFWLATIFLNEGLCLAPTKSLVRNIGLDNSGVHCKEVRRQIIRGSVNWRVKNFPEELKVDEYEYEKTKEFKRILNGCIRTPFRTRGKRWIKHFLESYFPSVYAKFSSSENR